MCEWHSAHPTLRPSQAVPVVLVRSTVALQRNSSLSTPPSLRAFNLCFDGQPKVEVRYAGYMGQSAVEAAEFTAKYRFAGGQLMLETGALRYDWPWAASKVTCTASWDGADLLASHCRGADAGHRTMPLADFRLQAQTPPK